MYLSPAPYISQLAMYFCTLVTIIEHEPRFMLGALFISIVPISMERVVAVVFLEKVALHHQSTICSGAHLKFEPRCRWQNRVILKKRFQYKASDLKNSVNFGLDLEEKKKTHPGKMEYECIVRIPKPVYSRYRISLYYIYSIDKRSTLLLTTSKLRKSGFITVYQGSDRGKVGEIA